MNNDDETQKPAFIVGWYNESLLADIWFSRKTVTAEEAAILLCGFNPNSIDAKANAFDQMECSYRDLITLFEGYRYNLMGYVHVAKQREIRYHPWVNEYLAARHALSDELSLTPALHSSQTLKAPFSHAETIRAAASALRIDLKNILKIKNGLASPIRKTLYTHLVRDRRVLTDSTFKRGWECLLKDLRESSST